MARKKVSEATEDLEKMDRAAGAAADTLSGQLESCREAVQVCLDIAWVEGGADKDVRLEFFGTAAKLMQASSALASALARLKGEFHQHITVHERQPLKIIKMPDRWPSDAAQGCDLSPLDPSRAEGGGDEI